MVLLGHLIEDTALYAPWFFKYGWTGVNLFFSLSGFLFTYLYFDKFANNTQSLKEYFLKRIIRIYPLTIFLVLVTVLTRSGYKFWDIFTHITLINSYFKDYRFSINSPMWSLTVEESFYFLVPILLTVLGKIYEINWLKTTKAKIAFIAVVLFFIHGGFYNLATQIINLKYYFGGGWDSGFWSTTIFGRFFDFGIGITAGLIYLKLPNSRIFNKPIYSISLFVAGVSLWLFAANWYYQLGGPTPAGGHKLYSYYFLLFSISASLMILSLVGNSFIAKFFALKPIVFAGKISFALYLIQFMAITGEKNLSKYLMRSLNYHLHNELLSLTLVCVILLILSTILYFSIEMPAQKYLKKLLLKG